MKRFSFYDDLLFTTLGLFLVELAIFVVPPFASRYCARDPFGAVPILEFKPRPFQTLIAVYLLLFAVSQRIIVAR